MDTELTDDLAHQIRTLVQAGYLAPEQVLEAGVDYVRDEVDDLAALQSLARRLVDQALADHAAEQADWKGLTDCDRLDMAFAALNDEGIVARQDFTCCQTCGHAEIADEIDGAGGPDAVRGYTFFHMQDTEAAVNGHGLYLAYGATEPGQDAAAAVGRVVAGALAAAGLSVAWDGDVQRRIGVDLTWRRRR